MIAEKRFGGFEFRDYLVRVDDGVPVYEHLLNVFTLYLNSSNAGAWRNRKNFKSERSISMWLESIPRNELVTGISDVLKVISGYFDDRAKGVDNFSKEKADELKDHLNSISKLINGARIDDIELIYPDKGEAGIAKLRIGGKEVPAMDVVWESRQTGGYYDDGGSWVSVPVCAKSHIASPEFIAFITDALNLKKAAAEEASNRLSAATAGINNELAIPPAVSSARARDSRPGCGRAR
jgi:hypothetical protein